MACRLKKTCHAIAGLLVIAAINATGPNTLVLKASDTTGQGCISCGITGRTMLLQPSQHRAVCKAFRWQGPPSAKAPPPVCHAHVTHKV